VVKENIVVNAISVGRIPVCVGKKRFHPSRMRFPTKKFSFLELALRAQKADASQNAYLLRRKFDVTNRVIGLFVGTVVCKNFVNSPGSFGGRREKGGSAFVVFLSEASKWSPL
jgi:hypothetical protein